MAAKRLMMKQIKEIFRLRFELKLSQRKVGLCVGCGRSTIQGYEARAKNAGLDSWATISKLSEQELLERLNLVSSFERKQQRKTFPLPDWNLVHKELSKKHVTLSLVWQEYKSEHPNGCSYPHFCSFYREWKGKLNVSLRQNHKAGEKVFVDYCGSTIPVIDRGTGEVLQAQIFVGVLGASSYTYAEATYTQSKKDWIMSHRRMLEFYGGVPQIIVPDNLKSAVKKPDRYESEINDSYREFSQYYGTCIIPARVRKPKDKAKAEAGVLLVSRWIIAALRNKTFYSLNELNAEIKKLLITVNTKKMRHFKKSRIELFKELDSSSLGRLRSVPYQYAEWKKARVNIDYHVTYDDHFYSAPYQLVKRQVDIRATDTSIEIYYRGKRVSSHLRSLRKGGYTTSDSHRPESHKSYLEWTPERIINWASSKGKNIGLFVKELIKKKVHPEQAYRSAMGVIRLSDKYGVSRLDKACFRAIELRSISYQTVKNLLKNKLEEMNSLDGVKRGSYFKNNHNVRGSEYYH
jgi:transposase